VNLLNNFMIYFIPFEKLSENEVKLFLDMNVNDEYR
jgi:hypothetical protein